MICGNYYNNRIYNQFHPMKPIQIRLVGRFKFISKKSGIHEHLLYKGIHAQTEEALFIKGEQLKIKRDNMLTILQEGRILQMMQGGAGIAHMHWCGTEEDYNFIVLEQLDRSLMALIKLCGGKFTHKTVLMLGQEIVSILQYFHFKNFIHNQIKPDNFMLGSGEKQGKLFIVDFSAASRFKDGQSMEHIEDDQQGTPTSLNLQFSSVRFQKGYSVSRRDDMESLIYLMLWMLNGSLPWSQVANNIKLPQPTRIKNVLKMKQQTSSQALFSGYPQLLMLFNYTRNLAFDQKPRYVYYKNVMSQKIQQLGMIDDHIYDWMLLSQAQTLQDPQINFDIIPNQAEFIKKIREELKLKEAIDLQKEQEKKTTFETGLTSPRSAQKEKCEIY